MSKSPDTKLHSYRSDKNKSLKRSVWTVGGSGNVPKRTNSNNQFR